MIPFTIPIFFVFLLILYGIIKLCRIKRFYIAIMIFGIMGWITEFFLGSYKEILWSSPVIAVSMSVFTILTYSVIVVVPLSILLENNR